MPYAVSFCVDIVVSFQNGHELVMIEPIVQSLEPITLIGGGHATPDDLQNALTLAPICVAADGGATLAIEAGAMPAAVIGDFDSVSAATLARIPSDRQHRFSEQHSTDFDKALRHIAAPVVIAVGFAGGRVDHQLAAFNTLVCHAHKPCVLMTDTEVIFVAPPQLDLPTKSGDTVSLFPLAAVAGKSSGLQWNIDGLEFAPDGQVGTSNHATGPVRLTFDAPGMLVILPRRFIQPVVARLALPTAARWRVRAGQ